jgi:hypothetical protein
MNVLQKTTPFRKTAACPSSATLVYFRFEKLSKEISTLVGYHLDTCEFCRAELALLAHHQRFARESQKAPEIPMNLRILAESILCHGSKMRIIR